METALVSIIMPMYNAGKFLSKSIESVLEQTYQNWELLLIDDGSKDDSIDIALAFTEKDSRIFLLKNEQNMGIAKTRNKGIEASKGQYIAFLDSDDIWDREKLEKQIRFMQENDYVITFTAYELMDENSNRMHKEIRVPQSVDYKTLLKGNVLGCLTVIINREKLGFDIRMSGERHEDYVLWLSILKKGITAYGIDEVLAMYRKSSTSLSGNKFKAAKWTWNIYRNIEKIPFPKAIYYFINYAINGIKKS